MTESAGRLPLRTLGASGITAPAMGLGCWALGGAAENLGLPMGWSNGPADAEAVEALSSAYDGGVRLFDTADVYGHGRSERLIGRLVAQVERESLVLVSKVGYFAGAAGHGYEPRQMRRRLEQTLSNLGTDHLDVYFLHHSDFGDDDRFLPDAVETMRDFKAEGLIRAVGMRGPHRFALDRLLSPRTNGRPDKVARFYDLFDIVRPDVLAVRDNLLSPPQRSAGIFAFAEANDVGVLVNKPLAQGLLTGSHNPLRPRNFDPGDHRLRKRWFTAPTLAVIERGLARVRAGLDEAGFDGSDSRELLRLALWACLERSDNATVLVGFTSADQVRANLYAVTRGPHPYEVIERSRAILSRVQEELDADGEVFVDEVNQLGRISNAARVRGRR